VQDVREIIKGVKPKPAYLLILGLAIVVVVPALARLDGGPAREAPPFNCLQEESEIP
jgi:hypothetical protein